VMGVVGLIVRGTFYFGKPLYSDIGKGS